VNDSPGQAQAEWDRKVNETLAGVFRVSTIYMVLGLLIYGGGSGILIYLLREQPLLVTLVVMYFFQLLVIIFGTRILFPNISGAFRVGLLANRDTVPVFTEMKDTLRRADERMEKASLDIRETGDKIHQEVKRLADSMDRPIRPPKMAPLVGPRIPVEESAAGVKDGGNGEAPC